MAMEMTTLCYVEKDECYLMLHRVSKQNDLNKDKWIGIGGHFEGEETPDECLLREVYEETGCRLGNFQMRGIVTFISARGASEYMFLFTGSELDGQPGTCDEGILEWVPKKAVPSLNLWPGDRIFLRLLEEDRKFFLLKLVYDERDNLTEARLDGKKIELSQDGV